jgi:hypothetical protein
MGDEASKKPTHVPTAAVEAYLKDLTASMRKELLRGLVTDERFDELRKKVEALTDKPFEAYFEKYDVALGTRIERKLRVAVGKKKLDEALEKELEEAIIRVQNRMEGVLDPDIEAAIKRKKKEAGRERGKTWMFGGAIALTFMAVAGVWYQSNRRTAEGAAGVARTARLTAEEARTENRKLEKEFTDYKKEMSEWQKTREGLLAIEKTEREKKLSELEQRLTGQITNKLDRTEWGAKAADLEKGIGDVQAAYKQLDALLKGELTKDESREKAYGQYKALAESSKKEIDGLRLRITELQTGFSTKDYTDKEVGRMKAEYDGMKKDLRQKYDGLLDVIKKMQNYMPYFDEESMKDEKSEPKK